MRTIKDTQLVPVPQIAGKCSRAKVWVKREDQLMVDDLDNHTTKIRRCAALIEEVPKGQKVVFVQITGGNYGHTLGKMAQEANAEGKDIQVVNVIDSSLPLHIKQRLKECNTIVVEKDLGNGRITDDDLRNIAMEQTGCKIDQVRLVHTYPVGQGYGGITDEINAAGVTPRYIFCPVGSGELAVALAEAAQVTWGANAPVVIGVTIPENVTPWWKLSFLRKRESNIAEKLVDPVAVYRHHIERFIAEGKMRLITLTDQSEIIRVHRWLTELGIPNEPSATVPFVAAMNFQCYSVNGLTPEDNVVIINTGKGIYDQKAVEKHWVKRLKTALRYAGIILATVAVTTLAVWGLISEQIKFDNLNRKLLEAQTLVYVDKDRDYWLDEEEATSICRTIPDKNCESPLAGPFIYGFQDFTDLELGFYVAYKRAESNNDMIGRQMMSDIRYAYEHNRFWVRGGEITWRHFDHTSKRWFHYDGSDIVWEDLSLGMGDICKGRSYPPSICPPDLSGTK